MIHSAAAQCTFQLTLDNDRVADGKAVASSAASFEVAAFYFLDTHKEACGVSSASGKAVSPQWPGSLQQQPQKSYVCALLVPPLHQWPRFEAIIGR